MNHQQAKQLASERLAALKQPGGPFSGEHPLPDSITLTDYETQEDFNLLRPEDGPESKLVDFRMLNTAFARLVRKEFGIRAEHRKLKAADYFRWLAETGKKNTAGSRAAFTGLGRLE